ncbi:Pyrrolo-quinoline quinone repeat-containing protein, partial [Methanotorris formicicus Mc-S-70]
MLKLWDTYSPTDSIAMSSDGRYVVAKEKYVYFFDRDKEKLLLWRYDTEGLGDVSMSSDGRYVVARAEGKRGGIYFFNRSGELLWSYKIDKIDNGIWVAISSDGNYIVAGSYEDDGKVYFFNRSGELLWSYETGDTVSSVAISSDGNYIVAGNTNGKVYFFNRSGELLWSYETGDTV